MKYFRQKETKNKYYALPESDIRDHEILTVYMTCVKLGCESARVIDDLSQEYYLSRKKIEQIVYPLPK